MPEPFRTAILVQQVMVVAILNGITHRVCIAALCADVGISRVHLNRKLKEFGLEPPSVLIRKCRMKQAARRLHGRKVQQIVIRIQLRLAYDHRIDLQGPISESH